MDGKRDVVQGPEATITLFLCHIHGQVGGEQSDDGFIDK